MRLICTIYTDKSEENPDAFSYYLTNEGIVNECEEVSDHTFRIWIKDEDQVDRALEFYEVYKSNPHDPRFFTKSQEEAPFTAIPRKRGLLSPSPYGPLTVLIILFAVTLFIWAQVQRGSLLPPKIPGVIQAPVLAPIERILLFDYPLYFEKRDELLTLYTKSDIEEKKAPSKEATQIMQELRYTPVWMGIYEQVVLSIRGSKQTLTDSAPLFEKISQGEVWRFITPSVLHFDLLHIFFNLLWFILLGNQIEFRLGWARYGVLIFITGIFSNTAQYLMSGSFFMGLSGIVCAMAAFIWARQQKAPWEGYLLHRFTLIFLALFVVGMFLLQTFFFFLQIFGNFELAVGIANTGHLSGALIGYLLGRMRFFAIRHPHP